MGRNEIANRCPDEAVVGGDPAVMAIEELIDRLPGVVDAAFRFSRLAASSDPDLPAIERKIQSADDYRRNR